MNFFFIINPHNMLIMCNNTSFNCSWTRFSTTIPSVKTPLSFNKFKSVFLFVIANNAKNNRHATERFLYCWQHLPRHQDCIFSFQHQQLALALRGKSINASPNISINIKSPMIAILLPENLSSILKNLSDIFQFFFHKVKIKKNRATFKKSIFK